MTGAKGDALELIRSLKEQYPDETEDQLISWFLKELEGDQALCAGLSSLIPNRLSGGVSGGSHGVVPSAHPHAWGGVERCREQSWFGHSRAQAP